LHVVLFPGAALPLHVFEPRYRAMMDEVLGTEKAPNPEPSFGVVCIRAGYEVGAPAETHDVGCLASVEQAVRHKDGTMDLVVRGMQRFRVDERPPDDPYPKATVSLLDEKPGRAPERAVQLARAALDRYLTVVARFADTEPPEVTLPVDPVAASFAASAMLVIDLPILQDLLESKTASDRLVNVAKIARSEAHLLETVGPPAPRPGVDRASLN
jgi:Lon protease-like protein